MTCPDPTSIRYLIVMWMLTPVQALAVVGIWELVKFLWRVMKPVDKPKRKV